MSHSMTRRFSDAATSWERRSNGAVIVRNNKMCRICIHLLYFLLDASSKVGLERYILGGVLAWGGERDWIRWLA